MTPTQMLQEWTRACGALLPSDPTKLSDGQAVGRRSLLEEEFDEVIEALAGDSLADLAKELADLVYVAYGTAVIAGIDLDTVLEEVHRSNMSKFGPNGPLEVRGDGKILKGPAYRPPDVARHWLAPPWT